MQITERNQILGKIGYLSKFITRAFFIALFSVVLIIFGIIIIYYADLYMNVKSGTYKNPIFNGYIIVSPSMVPTTVRTTAIMASTANTDSTDVMVATATIMLMAMVTTARATMPIKMMIVSKCKLKTKI